MGIMDKLAFWKHDDLSAPSQNLGMGNEQEPGLNLDDDSGMGAGITPKDMPEEPMPSQPPMGMQNHQPQFQQQPQMAPQPQIIQQQSSNKDLDLISAKLDAVKATMDNINQRLTNIERIAREGI